MNIRLPMFIQLFLELLILAGCDKLAEITFQLNTCTPIDSRFSSRFGSSCIPL